MWPSIYRTRHLMRPCAKASSCVVLSSTNDHGIGFMTGVHTDAAGADREIEFWSEFGSNYSYLSVMRIEGAAARDNIKIVWKPFLLGPIFKSFGWDNSPFVLQKEKGAYMWQDMARLCRKYGLRWTKPTTFPRLAVLPIRVALIGAEQSWVGEFCKKVMLL